MTEPADVVAAAVALAPLKAVADDDPRWRNVAAPTTWTAARVIEHISDALLFYSAQVARRGQHGFPVVRDGRSAPPSEQLDNALSSAHILTGLLRDLGPDRAWHPSGRADGPGWAGMAVTELLVHGYDAAGAMQVRLPLPRQVCARTVARVFPWIAMDATVADRLLLAVTGRVQHPDVPVDPRWWWQSAPLSEWNGEPRQRTAAPGWA